jgi:hypothetical protein
MNALKLLEASRTYTRLFAIYDASVLSQLRHISHGSEGINDLIVLQTRSKEVFESQSDLAA